MAKSNQKARESTEEHVWFYYDQGYSIIPLGKNEGFWNNSKDELKRPSIKSWDEYKTTRATKDEIQQWIDNKSFTNIGVICGHVSGDLVIIDIDDESIPEILKLKAKKILESGAWFSKTGKGYQIWLKHHGNPGGIKKPIKYKIEYRANNGYCVAPPSTHPNGKDYHFIGVKNLSELPTLVEKDAKSIFSDFKKKIGKKWNIKETKHTYKGSTKTVQQGEYPRCVEIALNTITKPAMRYYTIYGIASSFAMQGIPKDMALQRIKRFNMEKCTPPHSNNIIEQAVNGAYQPGAHHFGCEFWIDNAGLCPFENINDCYFGYKKIKKELLKKYRVIIWKENKEGKLIKSGINYQNLSKMIIGELDHHFVTLEEKAKPIWYFDGKCYRNNGEIKIGEIIEEFLPDEYNTHILTEVISYIQHSNVKARLDFVPPTHLINLENGVFNIETGELLPHSHKYLFNFVLPIRYDEKAKCPEYEKFLKEITTKDGVERKEVYDTLQEYLGFCFYREYEFKKYLIMDGENDNGKTTLMNVWINTIGEKNIASIPLQELNDKPFRKDKLYGKHGNFSDELPDKAMRYSNIIKEITGKSAIWADIKNHQEGVWFFNYAKPFFNCNQVPETKDIGNAFFIRQLQITLYNKYLPENNPDIDNKTCFTRNTRKEDLMTTEEEKSGIFNHAMEGLKRLQKNKRFSDTTTTEEKKKTWIQKSDPILTYFNEQIEETTIDWCIKCQDFLNDVQEYCKDNGVTIDLTLNKVTRKLSDMDVQKVRKNIDGQRKWVYLGIRHITDNTMNEYIGKKAEVKHGELNII